MREVDNMDARNFYRYGLRAQHDTGNRLHNKSFKKNSILLEIIKVDNKIRQKTVMTMVNRLNLVRARIKMPLNIKMSNGKPFLRKKIQARYSNPTRIMKYSTTQKIQIWQMPQEIE